MGSSVVLAQGQGGLQNAGNISGLNKTKISEQGNIPSAVGMILGQAMVYLGIVFFLLIVYAGLTWMTAGGTEAKVEKAKGILIAAVTGLIIVVAAYGIINFVFGRVIGSVVQETTKTDANPNWDFVECIDVNTTECVYNGTHATPTAGECPGGSNIRCCRVKVPVPTK